MGVFEKLFMVIPFVFLSIYIKESAQEYTHVESSAPGHEPSDIMNNGRFRRDLSNNRNVDILSTLCAESNDNYRRCVEDLSVDKSNVHEFVRKRRTHRITLPDSFWGLPPLDSDDNLNPGDQRPLLPWSTGPIYLPGPPDIEGHFPITNPGNGGFPPIHRPPILIRPTLPPSQNRPPLPNPAQNPVVRPIIWHPIWPIRPKPNQPNHPNQPIRPNQPNYPNHPNQPYPPIFITLPKLETPNFNIPKPSQEETLPPNNHFIFRPTNIHLKESSSIQGHFVDHNKRRSNSLKN